MLLRYCPSDVDQKVISCHVHVTLFKDNLELSLAADWDTVDFEKDLLVVHVTSGESPDGMQQRSGVDTTLSWEELKAKGDEVTAALRLMQQQGRQSTNTRRADERRVTLANPLVTNVVGEAPVGSNSGRRGRGRGHRGRGRGRHALAAPVEPPVDCD